MPIIQDKLSYQNYGKQNLKMTLNVDEKVSVYLFMCFP